MPYFTLPTIHTAGCCTLLAISILIADGTALRILADELPPAPADVQAMLDAGQVKLEFYSPQSNPRRFVGETKYDYSFRHSFEADYEPERGGGRTTVKIRLKNVDVSAQQTHILYLPEDKRGPGLWEDPLTRHEFDHVAISIDPRIQRLLQAVFQSVEKLELPLPPGEELTAAWVNREVDELFDARGHAVYKVVSFNNLLLDRITQHGTQAIENREAFFQRLYTKPNLDEADFALTGEVLELLKSEAYRQLEPHYLR
jgi:hypothetical protein